MTVIEYDWPDGEKTYQILEATPTELSALMAQTGNANTYVASLNPTVEKTVQVTVP